MVTKNSETDCEVSSIGVCLGPRCGDYGGKALLDELRTAGIDPAVLECQSLCDFSPVIRLPDRCLLRATLEDVLQENTFPTSQKF